MGYVAKYLFLRRLTFQMGVQQFTTTVGADGCTEQWLEKWLEEWLEEWLEKWFEE